MKACKFSLDVQNSAFVAQLSVSALTLLVFGWPIICWVGRQTLLTRSLLFSTWKEHALAGHTDISPNSTWLITSRHNTFDVLSPCILAVSSLSNCRARHARLGTLDTSNVSCVVSRRDMRSQVEFGLYCYLFSFGLCSVTVAGIGVPRILQWRGLSGVDHEIYKRGLSQKSPSEVQGKNSSRES